MKNIFFTVAVLMSTVTFTFAQKFAYVDTKYILENIPAYKEAEKKLDETASAWQKEIEAKYQEIDKLYKTFQAEQVLYTEDMKKQKEQEIMSKEKAVKDLQKQRFGYEGELFQKRQELVKPIQDKIYEAIQKLATEKAYEFIFDKSGGLVMLYASAKHDRSDDILVQMGYKPGKK